jgi:hypothetical protein
MQELFINLEGELEIMWGQPPSAVRRAQLDFNPLHEKQRQLFSTELFRSL